VLITARSALVGLALLCGSLIAATLVRRSLRRFLRARGIVEGREAAFSKLAAYVTVSVGIVVTLESMGLELDTVLAASTGLAVGAGFALQNTVENLVAGLVLLIEQPVRVGDVVEVDEAVGKVDHIGLRVTRILTRDEVEILVPNRALVGAPVINRSRPGAEMRIRVPVGVARGSDLQRVREALLAVARESPHVVASRAAEARFEAFGEAGPELALLVWIRDAGNALHVASELRFAIDASFTSAGIVIPFPQLDEHVRSGSDPRMHPRRA
jgi:potassium efflux system protein